MGNTTSVDRDGALETLTWGPQGNLDSIDQQGTVTEFIYDAEGNRVLRDDPDGMTLFLPGMELHKPAGTTTVTGTRYLTLPGGVTCVQTAGSPDQYQVSDHHGTAVMSIDPDTGTVTHRRMDPYGNIRGTPPAQWAGRRSFVGGTVDPTGYTHLGAREYDPTTGRFISLDPLMDLTDPQQMHGYAYANNNPLVWSDPTGLMRACLEYCGSPADKHLLAQEAKGGGQSAPAQAGIGSAPCRMHIPGEGCIWLGNAPPPDQVRQANLDNGSTQLALDAAYRDGGSCSLREQQIYCFGVENLYGPAVPVWESLIGCLILAIGYSACDMSFQPLAIPVPVRRPMTIGDVVVYTGSKQDFEDRLDLEQDFNDRLRASFSDPDGAMADFFVEAFGRHVEQHEAVHSEQWTRYDSVGGFLEDYGLASLKAFVTRGSAELNDFEREANLYWGGYKDPPSYRPDCCVFTT